MIVQFEEIKQQVLLGIYRLLYDSEGQEYFSEADIAGSTNLGVGIVFYRRVIKQLISEKAIESVTWDGDPEDVLYTLSNEGWTRAEKIALNLFVAKEPQDGVPASDRVVQLSDNQKQEIVEVVEALESEIKTSNEVSIALGDSKDRIEAELDAGKKLTKASMIRIGAITAVLGTPLRYLAEKFSGAAVGELAKKLLELLWTLMSK